MASACNLSWRACTVAISMMLLAASAFKAQAQTPTLRIKVAVEAASAGIVLFESQGQNAVLTVTATDPSGKVFNLSSFSPQWTVDNPDVVSLYGGDKGVSTTIVAQQDGHAIITVTALGQSATQRVAVGKARLELRAEDVLPEFRVARLEVSATNVDEEDRLAGRALLLGENGHNIVLKARAFNSSGKPIPLISLPVTWSTGDADVMEIDGESYEQVRVIGRKSGETTVTATLQGVAVTVQGYVGDARSSANPALLAEKAVAEVAPLLTATTTADRSSATASRAQPIQAPVSVSAPISDLKAATAPATSSTTATARTGVGPIAARTPRNSGFISGVLGDPSLPAPKFKIVDFSRAATPQNDPMVNTVRLEVAAPADWKTCPYTPMFHWDEGMPAVPAAHHVLGLPDTDAPYNKYLVMGKAVYFRPPVIPGQVLVRYPQVNARLYLVNCRNEYSNTLNFTVEPPEPTTFQIAAFYPEKITPGVKVIISGYMLAAWDTTSQKVLFHFKLGKTNAAGTGLDVVERAVSTGYVSTTDSYTAHVYAPALEGLGYGKDWVILDASLYIVKGGVRSNSLPIKYCSSSNGPTPTTAVAC